LKIYAHVEVMAIDADPELMEVVAPSDYRAKLERILCLRLQNFDWNCQQHITPRFTEAEVKDAVQPLQERLAQLETENAALRARLTPTGDT